MTQYFMRRYGVDTEGVRDLHRISQKVPSIAVTWRTHDDDPHLKPAEQFETDKSAYASKRVLFLVRDPRDVVVSYFFDYTKKKDHVAAGQPEFTGTMDEFFHNKVGGLRAVIRFLNIWAENTRVPKEFLMITYEDLQKDTLGQSRRAIAFLDKNPIDDALLKEAIAIGSFDSMKKLEQENAPGLRRNPNVDPADPDGYKVRRGKIGGFRDYLSAAGAEEAEQIMRAELSDFYACYKL
jgi:hypothetical protein